MRLVTQIARAGTLHDADGYDTFIRAITQGLLPDPNLPLDEWSEQFMIIPRSTGAAEYGKYRIERTPHARSIMQALSVKHPCRRVVLKASSQMMKTQIALNWLCYIIHQHPSNILWLMPTGKLHKRIVQRIDKVIESVDVVKPRVSPPGSRLATNSQDIKVFQGGTLFIATAGSAANLSEVPARFVSYDEIDQSDLSIDNQGDPVELAENRQTTHGKNAKSYYYSSPTIDGESRIESLYLSGTQRRPLADCVHCGEPQELVFENLIFQDNEAVYPCMHCGGLNRDSDKNRMFKRGQWTEPEQQSVTESFAINSMFQPYGWYSWTDLYNQHQKALEDYDKGQDERMTAFYNTRLARVFKRNVEVATYETLKQRGDDYQLRTAPHGVLFITAGVDTQDNRLAVQLVGWGRDLKAWCIDYIEFHGDPINPEVWDTLTEYMNTKISHASGHEVPIMACAIDMGGHRTEAVKNYVRSARINCPIAIHGAKKLDAEPLSKGKQVDVNFKGYLDKKGVIIHSVGTVKIKDVLFGWIASDGKKLPENRMLNFSKEFDDFYFAGVVSETYNRKTGKYDPKIGVRNEPLDTLVYAYAAAHHPKIRAHRKKERDWARMEAVFNNPIPKQEVLEVKTTTERAKPANIVQQRGKSMMGSLRDRISRRR